MTTPEYITRLVVVLCIGLALIMWLANVGRDS